MPACLACSVGKRAPSAGATRCIALSSTPTTKQPVVQAELLISVSVSGRRSLRVSGNFDASVGSVRLLSGNGTALSQIFAFPPADSPGEHAWLALRAAVTEALRTGVNDTVQNEGVQEDARATEVLRTNNIASGATDSLAINFQVFTGRLVHGSAGANNAVPESKNAEVKDALRSNTFSSDFQVRTCFCCIMLVSNIL